MKLNKQGTRTLLECLAYWHVGDVVQWADELWLIIECDKQNTFTLQLLNNPLLPNYTTKVDTWNARDTMIKRKFSKWYWEKK